MNFSRILRKDRMGVEQHFLAVWSIGLRETCDPKRLPWERVLANKPHRIPPRPSNIRSRPDMLTGSRTSIHPDVVPGEESSQRRQKVGGTRMPTHSRRYVQISVDKLSNTGSSIRLSRRGAQSCQAATGISPAARVLRFAASVLLVDHYP